ncbi:MAG: GtrA family protein [Rikenellaceae bacterium]
MLQNFIKFCIVGGSGVFVDMGITYACKEWLKFNKYVANSLGFIVAATSNFFLNRWWTFHSTNGEMSTQYLKFIGISMVGLGINSCVIYLLSDKLRWNFYRSKIGAIGVVTFWNFFMNYLFTF